MANSMTTWTGCGVILSSENFFNKFSDCKNYEQVLRKMYKKWVENTIMDEKNKNISLEIAKFGWYDSEEEKCEYAIGSLCEWEDSYDSAFVDVIKEHPILKFWGFKLENYRFVTLHVGRSNYRQCNNDVKWYFYETYLEDLENRENTTKIVKMFDN